jgi:hypothetical protein
VGREEVQYLADLQLLAAAAGNLISLAAIHHPRAVPVAHLEVLLVVTEHSLQPMEARVVIIAQVMGLVALVDKASLLQEIPELAAL